MRIVFLVSYSVLALFWGTSLLADERALPNIVLIYADDVGYGDLGCYGAKKIKTPNLDKLAASGLRFTDGHSAAATCTPSRYAMLTGEYAWRKKGTGILTGDAALIIESGRTTLPSILRDAGYSTGVVGKWHLGLGSGTIDWNGKIKPGPREIGFDESFIIPATGDRVPCVYVENGRVVGLDPSDPIRVSYKEPVGNEPTGKKNPELLKMKLTHGHDNTIVNGISRIGSMSGGTAARWVDEDMADELALRAVSFIERNQNHPFFLYLPTHDIHVPRVPHQRFVGTSECGTRGDVMQELDDTVGKVLAALDRLQLTDNTLVIFTSDNGPVLDDGYADGAVADLGDHLPAGPLKGHKYSPYEAGTRVPFIVRWPAKVKPGVSSALVCQVDFPASFVALVGKKEPIATAPDSENTLPALLGESSMGRQELVEQSSVLGLRDGHWKYISKIPGNYAGLDAKTAAKPQPAKSVTAQLYDLSSDLGETTNIIDRHPDRAKQMAARLAEIRAAANKRE